MSLTLRLTLTYLLITLAGVLLLGAAFVALAGRSFSSQREQQLGEQAELYAALLAELAASPSALQAIAPARPGADLLPPDTSARLFSTAGALLAGDVALGPFPSRAVLPLVRPALPLPASQVEGRSYVARPIAGPGGPIGVVELSRDVADDTRLLAGLRRLAVQAALVAAVVMTVVSVLVARTIARPMVVLTRRAEQLAATLDERGRTGDDDHSAEAMSAPRKQRWLASLAKTDELSALEGSLSRLDVGLRAYVTRIGELEQARARFFRSVSHELRTPLTALRAGLENLADAVPAPQQPALATLEGEVLRLGRLVDELLDPGATGDRFALLERAPVDLGALARAVANLLAGRAERAGVALRAEGAAVLVQGDADRLRQALLNLADNALRITPPGGSVLLSALAVGHVAQLAVADNGPGVPAEARERIWERGVRGDTLAVAGSAGLGLAIVREIAAAHGGRAWLDERHRPGARFVIELPRLTADEP